MCQEMFPTPSETKKMEREVSHYSVDADMQPCKKQKVGDYLIKLETEDGQAPSSCILQPKKEPETVFTSNPTKLDILCEAVKTHEEWFLGVENGNLPNSDSLVKFKQWSDLRENIMPSNNILLNESECKLNPDLYFSSNISPPFQWRGYYGAREPSAFSSQSSPFSSQSSSDASPINFPVLSTHPCTPDHIVFYHHSVTTKSPLEHSPLSDSSPYTPFNNNSFRDLIAPLQRNKSIVKLESPSTMIGASNCNVRTCQFPGCNKCSQGSTKFCIAHGGGRRCTVDGCSKGARDKKYCSAHGGGKRCSFENCSKAAVGGSKLCTGHGGGRRCLTEGCNKSAQSSTPFCVKHGGGRQCSVPDCSKVSRGKTLFCASHGGGKRCFWEGCKRSAMTKGVHCKRHSSCVSLNSNCIVPTKASELM